MRLYDYLPSGNGYKVRLVLHQLEIPCERIELDIETGATRTPEFLALNRNGRIPLLVLDDGTALAESNAIQCYLAEGTPLLPGDRVARAQAFQWMFFEQYSHEPYIAVVRHWSHTGEAARKPEEVAARRVRGYEALDVMDAELATRDWFAADAYTVADIALYAYTHVAHEGGFDLEPYPHVRTWLDRVRDQPRHIPITEGLPR